MKLKCVTSNVTWFTEGAIYDAAPGERPDIIRVDDNEGEKAWILDKTNSSIMGLNDATFEEVPE